MEIFEAFPPKVAALIAVVAFIYIACVTSPLLIAGLATKRHKSVLRRPWLFSIVLLIGSYGLLTAVGFFALIPIQAYLVFIGPQLDASNLVKGGPLTTAADFFVQYWWLMYGPILLISSILLCKYLLPKWHAITTALEG